MKKIARLLASILMIAVVLLVSCSPAATVAQPPKGADGRSTIEELQRQSANQQSQFERDSQRALIIFIVVVVVVFGSVTGLMIWQVRRWRLKKIVPEKVPWKGTVSSVQPGEGSYQFILLGTRAKPDGSEARFEKSVDFRRRGVISKAVGGLVVGTIFNGRQVSVYGKEDERGWIRATKIVDDETGAVTE